MPLLIIHENGQPDRLFELSGPKLVIGRGNFSDLVLPNVSVSRQHAQIQVLSNGGAILTTLADDNPVYDGEQELPMVATIEHGTKFRVGRYGITYVDDAKLDLFAIQQLAEIPRYGRRGGDESETLVISSTLHHRLLQIELRREFGALEDAEGVRTYLGAETREIGPGADIPCPGRWGSGVAAKISWMGAHHVIERASVFTKLKVNGEPQKQHILQPGDHVEVNGTGFIYRTERTNRKKKKKERDRPVF